MLPNLIDITYFETHPIYIDEGISSSKLNGIISIYQKLIAKSILGDVLYYEFDNDYSGGTFQTQKWIDFVDGYDYQIGSKNVSWKGFKDLLRYFVFFEYQKYNRTQQVTLGKIDPVLENSRITNDFTNEILIYNEGIELYGIDWPALFINSLSYSGSYRNRYYNRRGYINSSIEEIKPTAFNFLYQRRNEFENWEFTEKDKINTFGI